MNQPVDLPFPFIGACLNCRQLFLVTAGSANCLLCGAAPTHFLPLAKVPIAESEEPGSPMTDTQYLDQVAGLEPLPAKEEQPAAPEEEEEQEEQEENDNLGVLLGGIGAYMGDAGITQDDIAGWLERMGADPEAAATAVGRLAAVRELITQLTQPQEPQPEAPAEPVSPPAQPAPVAPGAGASPPQEEPDRTNPNSP